MAQTKMRPVDEMRPGRQWWYYTDCIELVPSATHPALNEVKTTSVVGISRLDKFGGQWKLDAGQASPAANDADAIFSTAKCFEFGNGKTFEASVRLDFAEANTNKGMLFFGFTSLQTAAQIVDTTGLPAASFDGVGMYKPNSQTFWSVINSVAAVQTKKDSNGTPNQAAAGSSSTQEWTVKVECLDSTTATATFFVDGIPLVDTNGALLKLTFTYTGAGAMSFYLGCKLGSTTRETLTVHKISFGGAD